MGTKNNPGKFDCYANAAPDEPMFILLGRDRNAPVAVRAWAAQRELAIRQGRKPIEDGAMVAEARQCADAMEDFRARHDASMQSKGDAPASEPQ